MLDLGVYYELKNVCISRSSYAENRARYGLVADV
jgi:hypothetical protein